MTDAMLDRLNELEERITREVYEAECPGITFDVKEDNLLHQGIAAALDLGMTTNGVVKLLSFPAPFKIPKGADYLAHFGTTIATRASLPRDWYKRENVGIRWRVKPHEVQHGVQHIQGVDAGWWPRFTTHSVLYLAGALIHTTDGEEYLAKVEPDAYAVTQTVVQFFTGTPEPEATVLAGIRAYYNLQRGGPATAEAILRSHYATMRAGGVPNVTMARATRAWLEANAADLKGRVTL